jgi:hypothetical protein
VAENLVARNVTVGTFNQIQSNAQTLGLALHDADGESFVDCVFVSATNAKFAVESNETTASFIRCRANYISADDFFGTIVDYLGESIRRVTRTEALACVPQELHDLVPDIGFDEASDAGNRVSASTSYEGTVIGGQSTRVVGETNGVLSAVYKGTPGEFSRVEVGDYMYIGGDDLFTGVHEIINIGTVETAGLPLSGAMPGDKYLQSVGVGSNGLSRVGGVYVGKPLFNLCFEPADGMLVRAELSAVASLNNGGNPNYYVRETDTRWLLHGRDSKSFNTVIQTNTFSTAANPSFYIDLKDDEEIVTFLVINNTWGNSMTQITAAFEAIATTEVAVNTIH